MPLSAEEVRKLQQRREDLKAQIASVGDMRPGSLVGRFRKCGKPGCHCTRKDSPGHGPSWSLTRQLKGKTVTRVIPAGPTVEQTKAQLAEYQRFRDLTRELIEVSDRLCHAHLEAHRAGSLEPAQKRGSKKHSRPKSSGRSKRS